MLSATTPHDQGDALRPLMRANADAWRYVCSGRAWIALKRGLGYIGFIRGADDPTVGANGWHPHLHVLLFFERPLTAAEQGRLKKHTHVRWASRIEERGYRRPSWAHGVELTVSHHDEYVTKLGLADELVQGMYKRAREGHRMPLQLLVDAEKGDERALRLYREFVDATYRRKRITWSLGLRSRYLSTPEESDEEIAALDEGPAEQVAVAVRVPLRLWATAFVEYPRRQSILLALAKKRSPASVEDYLQFLQEAIQLGVIANLPTADSQRAYALETFIGRQGARGDLAFGYLHDAAQAPRAGPRPPTTTSRGVLAETRRVYSHAQLCVRHGKVTHRRLDGTFRCPRCYPYDDGQWAPGELPSPDGQVALEVELRRWQERSDFEPDEGD